MLSKENVKNKSLPLKILLNLSESDKEVSPIIQESNLVRVAQDTYASDIASRLKTTKTKDYIDKEVNLI